MKLIATGVSLLLVSTAYATDMIAPFDYFWMKHGPTAATDAAHFYGPSGPTDGRTAPGVASWNVAQWNTNAPYKEMLPFRAIPCPEPDMTECYFAPGSNNVMLQFVRAGTKVIRIQSQARNQPCQPGATGGAPYELDSLIGPTYQPNYPAYPPGTLASPPLLNTLTSLTINFTLNVKYAAMAMNVRPIPYTGPNIGYACTPHIGGTGIHETVQQTSFLVAMTFTNTVSSQTMFYQLAVGRLGYVHNNLQSGCFWRIPPTAGAPANTLGYGDDVINTAGNSRIAVANQPVNYSFDILPRINFVLNPGGVSPCGAGVDTDLSHWRIAGAYMGHYSYGNIGAITEWSNIRIIGL